jgi:hypothetical protein
MNRSQRQIKQQLRKARKAGEAELRINVPGPNYHGNSSGTFVPRIIPVIKKPGFRAKKKPFPKVGDEGMTLAAQRTLFHAGRNKI